ncbi:MAG: methylase RsmC [Gemmataceae bacterium]|nr:methylase RsmC [Gemmataceae bacterium]
MSEPHPAQQLVRMIVGSWVSRAIYVAAKLRIADHLADGPRAAEDLAATTGVAAGPLYRLLRALAGVGVFAPDADGRFRLNPLAEPLRDGGPESLRALAVVLGEEQDRCWDDLLQTVRTGETAFDRLYGRPVFAYLGEHPEQAKTFDAAMTGFSGRAMRAVLDAYDLSCVATLADVGGGLGSNLAAALGRYPSMRGLLFDRPHVVERARPLLKTAGVAGRCTVKGGDFFERAPGGADAYLLGHIVHDWDDAKAGLILDNLRRAMPAGAKLLLVEYVLPEGDGAWFGKLLDVHMMAVTGGLERTAAEYRQLFAAHGFRLTRVVPTAGDVSVVEGVPA